METKLTIEDVLKDAVRTLNGISIPISQYDSIGSNLSRVAKNIQSCIDAINEQRVNEEPVKNQEPEPVQELVSEETENS